MIAGERDPKKLADMARSRMRPKIGLLEESFAGLKVGTFSEHHRFLLARMLKRIDQTDADIADLDAQIEGHLAPFDDADDRLDEIPGIGPTAAHRGDHRRDRRRHDPVPHAQPPGFVGQVRTRDQVQCRQEQGQRLDRKRQPLPGPRPRRSRGRGPAGPPLFSAPATDSSPHAAGRRRQWSRSADRSWSSSGTYSPTPTPGTKTSVPTATTAKSQRPTRNAATSEDSKPSATTSPSNPPPDRSPNDIPGSAALRRELPPAWSPSFSD